MTMLRPAGTGPAPTADAPPPATRTRHATWRDPRLVGGVVIVATCVLLGARVLAAADDTTAVWSVRRDIPAGATVDRGDLRVARVHFSGGGAESYVPATAELVEGSVALHDLVAGELLARSAVASAPGAALVEVPLSVAPDDLPADVERGATVDVWVTPKEGNAGDGGARARLALDDVVVVAVPGSTDSLAPQSTRQLIVGVDDVQADRLAEAIGQLADGRVVVTRQAGP